MKSFLIVLVTALTGALVACGGGSTPPSLGTGGTPAAGGSTVVVAGGSQLATFIQANGGALSAAPGSPISAVATTTSCAADPSNAFVVAAYSNATVISYRINSDSSATPITTLFTSGTTTPMAEVGGHFIFAGETSGTTSLIGGFILSSTGTLQATPNLLTNSPALDLIGHPNGHILLVSETPLSLQSFAIDPVSGQLTQLIQPFGGAGGSEPYSMTFVQNGTFLLTAEGVSPGFPIDVVSVDPTTGIVTRVGSPVTTAGVRFLAPHPNGRFVYGFSPTAITPMTVDTNGVVTLLQPQALPTGFTPTAATVDRAGATLLVTGANGSLLTFGLDPNTDLPTASPLTTTNLAFTPVCVFPK